MHSSFSACNASISARHPSAIIPVASTVDIISFRGNTRRSRAYSTEQEAAAPETAATQTRSPSNPNVTETPTTFTSTIQEKVTTHRPEWQTLNICINSAKIATYAGVINKTLSSRGQIHVTGFGASGLWNAYRCLRAARSMLISNHVHIPIFQITAAFPANTSPNTAREKPVYSLYVRKIVAGPISVSSRPLIATKTSDIAKLSSLLLSRIHSDDHAIIEAIGPVATVRALRILLAARLSLLSPSTPSHPSSPPPPSSQSSSHPSTPPPSSSQSSTHPSTPPPSSSQPSSHSSTSPSFPGSPEPPELFSSSRRRQQTLDFSIILDPQLGHTERLGEDGNPMVTVVNRFIVVKCEPGRPEEMCLGTQAMLRSNAARR